MKKEDTNYKKWSFKFLIYIILLKLLITYLIARTPIGIGNSEQALELELIILSFINITLLISGIVLTILSFKKQRRKELSI